MEKNENHTKGVFRKNSLLRRILFRVLIWFSVIYIGLIFIGLFLADAMIFPKPPKSYAIEDERFFSIDNSGQSIAACQIKQNSDWHLIFSHGNFEDIGNCYDYCLALSKALNINVIAYDYPGYGASEGKANEKTVTSAIEAVYQYLIDQSVDPQKVIVLGRSVGGGPSTSLAHKYPVGGLILESSFVSAFRVRTVIPIVPIDSFRNLSKIDEINCPLLLIHGDADKVIGKWHSEKLYDKAVEPKSFCWLENTGHNNVAMVNPEKYWQAIYDFVQGIKKVSPRKD